MEAATDPFLCPFLGPSGPVYLKGNIYGSDPFEAYHTGMWLSYWVLFPQRLLKVLILPPSDIVSKLKRWWSWPKNSFNGPLWAQLHKEKGVLPMSSSVRRIVWTECQWHWMAITCEKVHQLYSLSVWRTRNEKCTSQQVLVRFCSKFRASISYFK